MLSRGPAAPSESPPPSRPPSPPAADTAESDQESAVDADPSNGVWMANGAVVAIDVNTGIVAVSLLSCTGGLKSIDFTHTHVYTIQPIEPSVTYDRMQTAVGNFAIDEVTGCSVAVQQAILGCSPSPLAIAIRAVDSPPPSFPAPTEMQAAAIAGALTNPVHLIVGPPGTGKTTTTVHVVWAFVRQRRGPVLVCAPSNAAANHIARRLHSVKLNVVRVYATSREAVDSQDMPREVLLESHLEEGSNLTKYRAMLQQLGELTDVDRRACYKELRRAARPALMKADVVVCTCSNTYGSTLAGVRFDSVVIDEAGQAVEPEALMPITRGAQRVTLIGDTKQLGPVVKSRRASHGGLGLSLFARLADCGTSSTFLNVQFRMHPSIAAYPSQRFYDGRLLSDDSTHNNIRVDVDFPWPDPMLPVFFWHVRHSAGEGRGGRDGTSIFNTCEAEAVTACVCALIAGGATHDEIGVISMYDAQRSLITSQLRPTAGRSVKVANVDAFQGQERPFVILTLTRSNDRKILGFTKDPLRVNVALTRAQSGLIIVGDALTVAAGSDIWAAQLTCLSPARVVSGKLGAFSPFKVPGLRDAACSVTEEVFVASHLSTNQYIASSLASYTREPPAHHVKARDRTRLERLGKYSRFIRLESEPEDPTRIVMRQHPFVAAAQPSFVHLPVAGPSLAGCVAEGIVTTQSPYQPADRVSDVIELGRRLHNSGVAIDEARAVLATAFPILGQLGLDMVGAYYESDSGSAPGIATLRTLMQASHQLELLCYGMQDTGSAPGSATLRTLMQASQGTSWAFKHAVSGESEERMYCEAAVASGLDVLQPALVEHMVQLFHATQYSTVAMLRAEREMLTTVVHRLSIGAEHSLRLFQYFWRMRIVGTSSGRADDVDYWNFVHSTKPESTQALTDLVMRRSNKTTGRGVLVKRYFTYYEGSVAPITEPISSRVTRYLLYDSVTGRAYPKGGGAARDEQGTLIVYHAEPQTSMISYAQGRKQFLRASIRRVCDGDRLLAPLLYIHRFRPPRDMNCGYGAKACEHVLRHSDGQPVTDDAGQPIKVRYMATGADFSICGERTERVTSWYLQAREAFNRVCPAALALFYYGAPGLGAEAALQLGMHSVVVDKNTSEADPYFGTVAPQLYGVNGPRVEVINGDVLSPDVRIRAESIHPSATDIWLVYSTPPCVRGSTIIALASKPDARALPGDRPPARGDFGKRGAVDETLAEEVALRHRDYLVRGHRYMVETSAGNRYEPGEGVAVVEWDELMYGGRLQGNVGIS